MYVCLSNSCLGKMAGPKFNEALLPHYISNRRHDLREIIELDSGLVDILVSKKTLTRKHAGEIAKTLYNKGDKLLDFLLRRYRGGYGVVMEALIETGQAHVVNFVNSNEGM